jgi:enterochelin esterase-like enzyme
MPSTLLSKPLTFSIYLPPCYSDHPEALYPVLYMLHGQGFTDDQWVRLGATQAADQLISSGQARPFLIVMPYEENSTLSDPNTSHFGDALVSELVPWIDAHYPTCSQRICRAIGGSSRGAAWAVRIGLTHPALFAFIGAHSLPPFIGDLYQAEYWLRDIPAGQMPQLYLDIGRSDMYMPDARRFEQVLSDHHVPHVWLLNNGSHDEVYWGAHVTEYMQWYVSNWGK